MSKLKLAVIGGGHLGTIHARLSQQHENVELVAVVDPCAESRSRLREQLNVHAVSDYHDVLPAIDAAIIASPTDTHHAISREVLSAGVHVLIEKPMTTTLKEADDLVNVAAANDSVVQVGHVERFNPALDAVREKIGQPKYIEATRFSRYSYRCTDVGVVLDLMIHDLDLVASLVSGELLETRAVAQSLLSNDEDMAQARLEFSCGAVANLSASRCSAGPERIFKIFGTRGYAKVDLGNHSAESIEYDQTVDQIRANADSMSAEEKKTVCESMFKTILPLTETTVEPVNAILEEQRDWLNAINTGTSPAIDAVQGRRVVGMAESVLNAIANHDWHLSLTAPIKRAA